MKKIKFAMIALATVLMGGLLSSVPVWADNGGIDESDLCQDSSIDDSLKEAAGCYTTKNADEVINNVLKVVLGFVGIIAVGAMIYGGFLYITSTGDSGKVQRAKNVIIYGIVGLIVSLLAYAIVIFVSGSISG